MWLPSLPRSIDASASHGWSFWHGQPASCDPAGPVSVPNKGPPIRYNPGHLPEAEVKGQTCHWAKPNSVLCGDPEEDMLTLGYSGT